MAARRWALIIVGLLFLLFGTIMALQGADVLKDSPLMSGNQTYIYVGAVVFIVGLILIAAAARTSRGP